MNVNARRVHDDDDHEEVIKTSAIGPHVTELRRQHSGASVYFGGGRSHRRTRLHLVVPCFAGKHGEMLPFEVSKGATSCTSANKFRAFRPTAPWQRAAKVAKGRQGAGESQQAACRSDPQNPRQTLREQISCAVAAGTLRAYSPTMSELGTLRVWNDPAILAALSWYLDVAANRRPAKFRIAACSPPTRSRLRFNAAEFMLCRYFLRQQFGISSHLDSGPWLPTPPL